MRVAVSASLWDLYFDSIAPRLAHRAGGFAAIFQHLRGVSNPTIIETGVFRKPGNYEGDGCSTLLFDEYIKRHGGRLLSVDLDPAACALARKHTTHAEIYEGDSVAFLASLPADTGCDVLYLDSMDVEDWQNDWAPAAHHLKELFAARHLIHSGTLIVVDDNVVVSNQLAGKGRLVFETMQALGIPLALASYQLGWVWSDEIVGDSSCGGFPESPRLVHTPLRGPGGDSLFNGGGTH